MAGGLTARQVGLLLVTAGMLSDIRTSGHGQREPLSVGERGQTNWHGVTYKNSKRDNLGKPSEARIDLHE